MLLPLFTVLPHCHGVLGSIGEKGSGDSEKPLPPIFSTDPSVVLLLTNSVFNIRSEAIRCAYLGAAAYFLILRLRTIARYRQKENKQHELIFTVRVPSVYKVAA